jgi:hypothetical protein
VIAWLDAGKPSPRSPAARADSSRTPATIKWLLVDRGPTAGVGALVRASLQ